jgi:protein-tyrosine-phosphatase
MPVRVLFLCTGNSARSIIAEALLTHLGGPAFAAASAGTQPRGVHALTAHVLREACIDHSHVRSKSVDELPPTEFDYVITLCDEAADACPVFVGPSERLHWRLPDPARVEGSADRLQAFRDTVEDLRRRLSAFIPLAERVAARRARRQPPVVSPAPRRQFASSSPRPRALECRSGRLRDTAGSGSQA